MTTVRNRRLSKLSLFFFFPLCVTEKTEKMKLYLAAAVLMLVLAVHTGNCPSDF